MNREIRILIADDHAIVRTGLAALLNTEPGVRVVGEAKNGAEAIREALRYAPDIVIMDLMMPQKDGAEATAAIRQKLPQTRVLILTTYGSSDDIAHALKSGAAGVIMKTAPNEKLIAALRKIAAGEAYIAPEVKRQMILDPPTPQLSPRQAEVLQSLQRGLTNRDIALQLSISVDRVEQIVKTLLTKLDAANRTEAVAIALRKHLLKMS